LPETGPRNVDDAALLGLGLLGLGIVLIAAGSLPWRRQPAQ
jgi:LPXTG-motif cell wall-anchored protein